MGQCREVKKSRKKRTRRREKGLDETDRKRGEENHLRIDNKRKGGNKGL